MVAVVAAAKILCRGCSQLRDKAMSITLCSRFYKVSYVLNHYSFSNAGNRLLSQKVCTWNLSRESL